MKVTLLVDDFFDYYEINTLQFLSFFETESELKVHCKSEEDPNQFRWEIDVYHWGLRNTALVKGFFRYCIHPSIEPMRLVVGSNTEKMLKNLDVSNSNFLLNAVRISTQEGLKLTRTNLRELETFQGTLVVTINYQKGIKADVV